MSNTVRIAVMGMTGAGKSTFIQTLIPDAEIAIGGDLNSRKFTSGGAAHADPDIRNH